MHYRKMQNNILLHVQMHRDRFSFQNNFLHGQTLNTNGNTNADVKIDDSFNFDNYETF